MVHTRTDFRFQCSQWIMKCINEDFNCILLYLCLQTGKNHYEMAVTCRRLSNMLYSAEAKITWLAKCLILNFVVYCSYLDGNDLNLISSWRSKEFKSQIIQRYRQRRGEETRGIWKCKTDNSPRLGWFFAIDCGNSVVGTLKYSKV